MKIELNDNKVFFEKQGAKKEIHPFWLRERVNSENFLDQKTQQRLFDPTMLKKIKRAEKAINAFEDLAYKDKRTRQIFKKIRAGKTLTFEESEAQKKIFQKFLANFNKNPRDADFYNVMAGIIRERSEDSLEAISQRLGQTKGITLDLVQKFKEPKKL